jgi:hypothetical protein
MNDLIEQYELVKETKFIFNNIEPKIIGKIYKVIKGPNTSFMWTISHFCRKEDEFDSYTPSAPFGQNIEETEHKLLQYIKRFETAVDWKQNEFF